LSQAELPFVEIDCLREGLFVHLELGWMDHPFTFSSFKIRSAEQLAALRALGLERVRYDPRRSDVEPRPSASAAASPEVAPAAENPLDAARKARAALHAHIKEAIARGEREVIKAAGVVRGLTQNLLQNPAKAVEESERFITLLANALLADQDISVHLISDKVAGEETYYHSLNVAVLAMLLARALACDAETVKTIGMGALFHDIGMIDVPDRVRMKKEARNAAEEQVYRQHCAFGVEIARRVKLPPEVIAVIGLHHERMDGSGYPQGLKGDALPPAVRIVSAAEVYDELCNPLQIDSALTPHEALSALYARERARFAPDVLSTLIRTLGVYPPGTVVKLSNDAIGLVVSVNELSPLRPAIVVYDAAVPKDEAAIVDLAAEKELSISKAMRPGLLPREIYEYLSPRKRVTYFFDAVAKNKPERR